MVAVLSACCLSWQIYLVFIHSQNADVSEQRSPEEKVEKPPGICSLSWTVFSVKVPQLGYPAPVSFPRLQGPHSSAEGNVWEKTSALLQVLRTQMVLYPSRATPDHKFAFTAQDSTTLKLPRQPCTPTCHHAEPWAWPLNAIQLRRPAAIVVSALTEALFFCSIIWYRTTQSFQHLSN